MQLLIPAALALLTFHIAPPAKPPVKPAIAAPDSHEVLRGVKGIELIIEDPCPDAEGIKLSREDIATRVELALRKHGVAIASAGSDLPWLYVTTTIKDDLFHISLNLNETVTLRRPKPTICPAATVWTKQSFGVHGGRADNVLGSIERVAEKLSLDWVKAHPK